MTRNRLIKLRFKAYQQIDWIHPRRKYVVECMLVSVDFDKEVFCLQAFPHQTLSTEEGDEFTFLTDEFHASISDCDLPKPKSKLKVIK